MAEGTSPEIQKASTLVKLQPDNPEAYFLLGLAYEDAGQVGESMKAYEVCVKLNARHSKAYLHRGFHLAKNGELALALSEWNRAFDLDPNLAVKLSSDPTSAVLYKQKIESVLQQFNRPLMINPKDAFGHYQLGTAYKYFNRLELAIQSLKRSLDINPRLWEAYHQCGEIYARLEQFKLAINNFKRAVESNPRNAESHYQLATVYERENMSAMAVKHLEEAIKLDPEASRFYVAFGRVYIKQTKYKLAMRQFQKALDLDPKNPMIHLHLAECCKELYRPDLALVSYEKAVELDPNFHTAIYELGTIALQLGEIDKAISSFEKALEINHEDAYARYHLAQSYHRKGDWGRAESNYAAALQLNPKDAFTAYNLGQVREKLGKVQEALAPYRQAIALKPQDAQFHLVLAKACLHTGLADEAISQLKAAIALNPNDLETNFLLADSMMRLKMFDEAISMYRKVVEINPESVEAHNRLAEAFYRLEMFDFAFESYQQALRLNSKHVASLHGMGTLYLRYRKKPSIAVDFFQQALELEPTHAPSIASLGEAYVALNQPEKALQFFERKLEENRENPDYLSKYAEALALAGQGGKAIEELKRALQLDPENTLVRSTLARMYQQERLWGDAVDQWKRLAQQHPTDSQYSYFEGMAYEEIGEVEKAKLSYNEALVRNSEHAEAMVRLEALYGEGEAPPRPAPRPAPVAPAPVVPEEEIDEFDFVIPPQPARVAAAPVASAPTVMTAQQSDELDELLGLTSAPVAPPAPPSIPTPQPEPIAAPAAVAPVSQPMDEDDDLLAGLLGGGSSAPPAPPSFPSIPSTPSAEESFAPPSFASGPEEPTFAPPSFPTIPSDNSLEALLATSEPEPVAKAAPVTPAPENSADDGEDIGDFLRSLGYDNEEEAAKPSLFAPVPEVPPVEAIDEAMQEQLEVQVDEAVEEMVHPEPEAASPATLEHEPLTLATVAIVAETSTVEIPEHHHQEPPAQVREEALETIETTIPEEPEMAPPAVAEAIEPAPAVDVNALLQTAVMSGVLGKPDEAEQAYQQILAAAPGHYQAYFLYGQFTRTVRDDTPKAIALLTEGRRLAEAASDAAVVRQIDQELSMLRSTEAPAPVSVSQEAPVASMSDADLEDAIGVVHEFLELGKVDRARARLEAIEKKSPGLQQVQIMMAETYVSEQNWPLAADYFGRALKAGANSRLQLAHAQEQSGDKQAALATYIQALPGSAAEVERLLRADITDHRSGIAQLERLGTLVPEKRADDEIATIYTRWQDELPPEEALAVVAEQTARQPEQGRAAEARVYLAWARKSETEGKPAEAVQHLSRLLETQPAQAEALAERQRLFGVIVQHNIDEGDYESAIDFYEGQPDSASYAEKTQGLYKEWASAHQEAGEFEAAVQVYARLLERDGSDANRASAAEVYQAWSRHFEQEGDYEQAIETLHRQARELNKPDLEQVCNLYRDWARYLKEDGHSEAARDVLLRLLNEQPDSEQAQAEFLELFSGRARQAEEKGDFGAAIAVYEELQADKPELANAQITRIKAAWAAQLEAAGNYAEALQQVPEADAHALRLRWGQHEQAAKNYEEALKVYADLGSEAPIAGVYQDWRAELVAAGEYGPALDLVTRWIAAQPASPEAKEQQNATYRAWTNSLTGEKAAEVVDKWLAASPDSNEAREQRTKLFQSRVAALGEQPEQALEVVEQWLAKEPASPDAREERARLYGAWIANLEAAGQGEQAMQVLDKFAQIDPDRPEVRTGKTRIITETLNAAFESKAYARALDLAAQLTAAGGDGDAEKARITAAWTEEKLGTKDYSGALELTTDSAEKARITRVWADEKLAEKDYAGALELAADATEKDRIRKMWADEKLAEKDYAGALEVITDVDEKARIKQVWADQKLAEKDYAAALDLVTDKAPVLAAWSAELLAAKDYAGALEVVARGSESKGAVYSRWSEELQSEGDYEESLQKLSDWQQAEPGNAEIPTLQIAAYSAWAEGMAEEKLYEASLDLYAQLIELAGDKPPLQAARTQALEATSVVWKAWAAQNNDEATYHKWLAAIPDAAEPKAALERLQREAVGKLEQSGDVAGALEALLNIGGTTEEVVRMRFALAEKNTGPDALEQYKAILATEGVSAESQARAQSKLAESGLDSEIQEALKAIPDDAEVFFRERLGQFPDNSKLHDGLYQLYGDPASGRKLVDFYRDLQKSNPDQPTLLLHLARAYCHVGKDTLAVVQFRKLVQTHPSAQTFVDLGEAYGRLKKPADALKSFASALELDPTFANAHIATVRTQVSDPAAAKDSIVKAEASVTDPAALAWLAEVKAQLEAGTTPSEELLARRL